MTLDLEAMTGEAIMREAYAEYEAWEQWVRDYAAQSDDLTMSIEEMDMPTKAALYHLMNGWAAKESDPINAGLHDANAKVEEQQAEIDRLRERMKEGAE